MAKEEDDRRSSIGGTVGDGLAMQGKTLAPGADE
jgi:hypothetical protein